MLQPVSRRSQLLAVALDLMDERGVRGASMRELARRAGVDVRSAYYHFESKRDLLRALFEQAGYLEPLDPAILAALRSMSREDAMTAIIKGNLNLLHNRARQSRLIHAEVLVGDKDSKTVGRELWDRWGAQLEALVDAGRIVPAPKVGAFARQLRSLLWGIFNESQLTGELEDPARRKARSKEVARVLLPSRRRTNPGRART